jgi:hypothetical protein
MIVASMIVYTTARLNGQAVDAESAHDKHVAVVAVTLGRRGADEACG